MTQSEMLCVTVKFPELCKRHITDYLGISFFKQEDILLNEAVPSFSSNFEATPSYTQQMYSFYELLGKTAFAS